VVSVDPSVLEALAAKTLPHHREAEEAVIGSLLQDREAIGNVVDVLEVDDFYVVQHRIVFQAILDLYDRGGGVDVTIVGDQLQKQGDFDRVGGALELTRLLDRVPSAANVVYHAEIVRERSLQRRLISAAQRILEESRAGGLPIEELIDGAEQVIFDVARRGSRGDPTDMNSLMKETLLALDARHEGDFIGVRSRFPELDDKLSGLQPGQMVVLAARPSVGKTTFALNIARHAATENDPPTGVAIFSLEMPKVQLALNIAAAHAQVDAHKIRRGTLTNEERARFAESAGHLASAPIYIDDTPGMTALQIRAKARRLKAAHDIGLVVVDYMQLITAPMAESRQQEISLISMSLKRLAREISVPVIAISQLNRSVDAREDHRPRMSDLRESGSIEQDADVVLFLYREDYYDGGKNPQTQNQANCIIAKNRNGPIGEFKLSFFPDQLRFEPFSDLDFRG
jgi:replicative DNA helicase